MKASTASTVEVRSSDRTEPLVSVVTPCYNTERFLTQCIDSVLKQSYQNWEIVFLDNQSTDASLSIARRFAQSDDRIKIHENAQFLPQLENYNRALTFISPRSVYTQLLEADNWMYRDCLTDMVGRAESDENIGVVSAYSMCETHLRFTGLPYSAQVVDGRHVARLHFLEDAYLFGAPTTVLVRSDVIRNRSPFFDPTIKLCSDLNTYFQILATGWDFGFVHQVLTFVRTQNEGSIQASHAGMDAMALDRLAVLHRHGRDFLDEKEFRQASQRTEQRYYRHLARAWLARRTEDYWRFHREGLAELGRSLSRTRIVGQVLAMAAGGILNPGSSLAEIWRRIRGQDA